MNLLALQADGLEIAYIVVGILLGIAVVVALIAQLVVIVGYWRGNRTQNSLGISGGEFARKLLDEKGLQDVQVKRCTLLRTLLFGNHYSIARKTVFLRIMTINKTSVTSVAIAAQKVALAEQHRDGNKKMIVRGRLQGIGVFAPSLFLPLVIVGILMDLFVFENLFMTLIVLILGIRVCSDDSEHTGRKERNEQGVGNAGGLPDGGRNDYGEKGIPQLFD